MQGWQITFFTHQNARHGARPMGEWLVQLARELGLRGATHATRFFELAEQPMEVVMALSEEETQRLFERLQAEGVHLFYVKAPVEFGTLGETPG